MAEDSSSNNSNNNNDLDANTVRAVAPSPIQPPFPFFDTEMPFPQHQQQMANYLAFLASTGPAAAPATPSVVAKRLTVQIVGYAGNATKKNYCKSVKIRRVVKDPNITVEDWLYEFLSKELQAFQLLDLYLKASPHLSAIVLSLGPNQSFRVEAPEDNATKKRKKVSHKVLRMELLADNSAILLSPRDSLLELIDADEHVKLVSAGEGSWGSTTTQATKETAENIGSPENVQPSPKKRKLAPAESTTKKQPQPKEPAPALSKKRKGQKEATAAAATKTKQSTKNGSTAAAVVATTATGAKKRKALKQQEEKEKKSQEKVTTTTKTQAKEKKAPAAKKNATKEDNTATKANAAAATPAASPKRKTAAATAATASPKRKTTAAASSSSAAVTSPKRKTTGAAASSSVVVTSPKRKSTAAAATKATVTSPKRTPSKRASSTVSGLGEYDVLLGSGSDQFHHGGNAKYHEYIDEKLKDYADESKREGILNIIMAIFRFHKRVGDSWKPVPKNDPAVMTKMKRDCNHHLQKQQERAIDPKIIPIIAGEAKTKKKGNATAPAKEEKKTPVKQDKKISEKLEKEEPTNQDDATLSDETPNDIAEKKKKKAPSPKKEPPKKPTQVVVTVKKDQTNNTDSFKPDSNTQKVTFVTNLSQKLESGAKDDSDTSDDNSSTSSSSVSSSSSESSSSASSSSSSEENHSSIKNIKSPKTKSAPPQEQKSSRRNSKRKPLLDPNNPLLFPEMTNRRLTYSGGL